MGLRKKGNWWFGDSHEDIRSELERIGKLNEYVPTQFASPTCSCGGRIFQLEVDDAEGAAVRTCTKCNAKHAIGDSDDFLEEEELVPATCVCGKNAFEITVGASLYDDSDDVRWLYVGCRCPSCGLTGCYGDWKNEFLDYRKLLERV